MTRIISPELILVASAAEVAVGVVTRELGLTTGPEMASATPSDPSMLSYTLWGFDQGAGSALAIANSETDLACKVQYLFEDSTDNRFQYPTGTDGADQTDPHAQNVAVTNYDTRGALLNVYWRWWYDGRISDNGEGSPWLLFNSGEFYVPVFGGDPTINGG